MSESVAIFDGHNDAAWRMYQRRHGDPIGEFLDGNGPGHVDLLRARAGHLVGGLFALYAPSPETLDFSAMQGAEYDVPLPPPLDQKVAASSIMTQFAQLLRLEAASEGAVAICRSVADIRTAVARGTLAVVVHLEGAEAIDENFYVLDILHGLGLRSIGPVWSRPNIFGHGVPLRFPGSPDTGAGLTDLGFELVRHCNSKKIVLDVSHLNEKGFWDIARTSNSPLVATHSNVFSICPSPRNLTGRQLDAIRDSNGFVGLNFATSYLRDDGQMQEDTDLVWMLRHLDALIEHLGDSNVGFGSDFDGAKIPRDIGSAAGCQTLVDYLRKHGYNDALLRKIGSENWLSLLGRILGD